VERERLAIVQGAFDVVTGVWPLVSLRSFEAITGPKPEGWLVKTAGTLIAGVGVVLALAGAKKRVTPELVTLGVATAAGLAAIDLYYAGVRRRISPVYLLDALVEIGMIGAWARTARRAPDAPADVVRGIW
jgi:hypothetical protein